ncbi:2-hydroxyacyl-CoA dehydratase family protein [Carboxydothermus ferrireducens]|uniref:Benzoyl-CoA reductase/2-hydroxyglutaryl-CoA dehydratase subunit BcrC/BadD/HgdB n=1 Tax=Carboxydothermus ferrireducens DSM 11255 TaxID=1119529 RepID=A0ABX2R6E8_9THEO|nr:2-hydroxyacyl-CoA dehydratase family protein [Carboxydothermus ferrireducens]NYE56746.1 benzoyl-CoA reductase/2-hydroxyglutaryl-CoA dehydratase subunit BcrC/BadD/HgdB [Carboxydothermus ferrireducens DSM 11255]
MKLNYFCSYWPVEISEGAGISTVRYFPADESKAPVRLPAYCCSYARGSLAEIEEEGDGNFWGFAHSCDTMQCLYGITKSLLGNNRVFLFVPPVDLTTAFAREYYREALIYLWRELSRKSGVRGEEKLKLTWKKLKELRNKVKSLENLTSIIPSSEIFEILKKLQTLPLDEALEYFEFKEAEFTSLYVTQKAIGIILTGAVVTNSKLYLALEQQGFRVFYDDTCTGFRHFAGDMEDKDDILEAIVYYYLSKPPCPCRHKGVWARAEYLKNLYHNKNARAIVLLQNKFCDPFAWDVPYLVDYFKKQGVPVLVLEVEGGEIGEQNKTRLQAFRERVGGG